LIFEGLEHTPDYVPIGTPRASGSGTTKSMVISVRGATLWSRCGLASPDWSIVLGIINGVREGFLLFLFLR